MGQQACSCEEVGDAVEATSSWTARILARKGFLAMSSKNETIVSDLNTPSPTFYPENRPLPRLFFPLTPTPNTPLIPS